MKKYNWKTISLCSLILVTFVISPILAEINRKDERQKDDVKGNIQLVFDEPEEAEKSGEPAVEESKDKKSFFEKLFQGRKKKESTSAPVEEEITEEATEESTSEKVEEAKSEKSSSIFTKIFGSRKKKEEPVEKIDEKVEEVSETTPETEAKEVVETAPEKIEAEVKESTEAKEVAKATETNVEEAEASSETGKQPVFKTWLKRTLGVKSRAQNVEVVDTEKAEEEPEVIEEETAVAAKEDKKRSFKNPFSFLWKKSKDTEEKTEEVVTTEETTQKVAATEDAPEKEAKSETSEEEAITTDEPKETTTVVSSTDKKPESKKGFRNPFKSIWKKSEDKKTAENKVKSDPSKFHNPEQLSVAEYNDQPVDKEAALGVVGEVKGEQVGPFSRPGRYDLSGTKTGLLLPINNKDELNTKEDIVSVIMKQPALLSLDSYSSISVHKVISINEIVLNRGRFRLKTLEESGLWTVRGRETLLSVSANSDIIFDMTGTLITKIFVLSGEAHCLPKVGDKPIKIEAGQMVHHGLSETKTADLSAEQTSFFENRFSLASEETLAKKLDAAGVFSTRANKNWPMDAKIYSGILCTNCSYAFDSREAYYDVCPQCHTNLIEFPAVDNDGEAVIQPVKNQKKKSYKWSKWFFGIKPKGKSK